MNREEIQKMFDKKFGIEEFMGDDFDETQFVLNNCKTTEQALSFFFDEILPDILYELKPDIIFEEKCYKEKAKEKYNITL